MSENHDRERRSSNPLEDVVSGELEIPTLPRRAPLDDPAADLHARVRELGHRVARLEQTHRRWKALALSAVTAAAGSLVAVSKGLYERGAREGAAEIRLQHVERELRLRARADRRRSERPDAIGPIPSAFESKGPASP